MIKNVVFDFGSVLVQHDFVGYFTQYFHDADAARRFCTSALPHEFSNDVDRALHPFRYYLEQQQRQWPEYTEALECFDKHFADMFTGETEGMYEWMSRLKAEGYRLLGLSNWSAKVLDVMARFPRVFSLLEDSLISYTCHYLKPERELYALFLERFAVLPEECVFIDDRAENIDGARQVGMHGIVFHDMKQLDHDFQQIIESEQ